MSESAYASQNQTANINVGEGYAATDGEWIYFSDWERNQGKIFKIKADGTGLKKLNNENSRNIIVKNGWVYYLSGNDWNKYSMYKMKIDGSNKIKLYGPGVDKMHVYGEWIFFNTYGKNITGGYEDGHDIYKLKIDGTGKQKIYSGKATNIVPTEDSIYFLDWERSENYPYNIYGNIVKINKDGKTKTLLIQKEINSFDINGKNVYYLIKNSNTSNLFRKEINSTSDGELIHSDGISSFIFLDNTMYYTVEEEETSLKKLTEDGKVFTLDTVATPYLYINIIGDYIFYRSQYHFYTINVNGNGKVDTMNSSKVINYSPKPIHISIDGELITLEQAPVIINGRTLVPIRKLMESLDANVKWFPENQEINIIKKDQNIQLFVGSNNANINGQKREIDAPAQIINGHTMIPLRFIGQALGKSIEWDKEAGTIFLTE